MRTTTVRDMMTRDPFTVSPETAVKDVIDLIVRRGISAVPVVAADGSPLGVVSEADLLRRPEHQDDEHGGPRWFDGARAHEEYRRAGGLSAFAVMSTPVRTIAPDTTLPEAARELAEAGVRRLFVLEDGRLAGVLSRRDLLRGFLRHDEDIRAEVDRDVFGRGLHANPAMVRATVEHGVVTLTGRVEYQAAVAAATRLTGSVPGVVGVRNRLDYQWNGAGDSAG